MNRRAFLGAPLAGLFGVSAVYGQKAEALSGDSFILSGVEHRLADIVSPRLAGFGAAEPHAEEARNALSQRLAGGLEAVEEIAPTDRWGRRIVQVRANNADLAMNLVAAGAVRVRPESDAHALIDALLSAENDARRAKRGLWAYRAYAAHDALNAGGAIGRFALVEGVVKKAVAGRGRYYLNFDDDYRTDFTVTAPSRAARRWAKEGLDLLALEGAQVRARGHVAWINGPSLELLHRQAIEAL